MKTFFFTTVAALAAAFATPAAMAGEAKPLTVVELFTSQGCSSCPAADKFLTELAKRDEILPLSFHVDYWDYIGWKDPFSSAEHTARQRQYAPRFNLRYVYTPQMVVHGADQAVGSDRAAIKKLIARHGHSPRVAVAAVAESDGRLTIRLPESALDAPANLWMATFDSSHTTEVRRGENAGRTITNANVVRDFTPLGSWNGKARTLTIDAAKMAAAKGDQCAVVVQSADKGAVLGATRVSLVR